MATNNDRGTGGGNRSRRGRNNNPQGRNQHSGLIGTARDNPLATAATVGGAVAVGLFLWSRRTEISDQISNLADQLSEWREGIASGDFGAEDATSEAASGFTENDNGRSQTEIAEEALTLKEIGRPA